MTLDDLLKMKLGDIGQFHNVNMQPGLFEVLRVPGGWVFMRNATVQEAAPDPTRIGQKNYMTFQGFGVFVPEPFNIKGGSC